MNKIIEKVSDQLKPLLHKLILGVSMDGQSIKEGNKSIWCGEQVGIYFSDNFLLQITTDDIPHFYGEGDLDLKLEKNSYIDEPISKFRNKTISEIKIYTWSKKGINLFKVAKYFVQIEFYHNGELLLSSGFFYFDESTNKMECLITGELSIDFIHGLLDTDFEENLLVKVIS